MSARGTATPVMISGAAPPELAAVRMTVSTTDSSAFTNAKGSISTTNFGRWAR